MAVIDGGNSTAGKMNVDANYNAQVRPPINKLQTGFVNVQYEQDAGYSTLTQLLRSPSISPYNKLGCSNSELVFNDTFNVSAQNTALWKNANTTFTISHASGQLIFNASGITTTGSSQIYQSHKVFPLFSAHPLVFEGSGFLPVAAGSNMVWDNGLFSASTTSAPYTPTDGAFIRITSAGLYGVLSYAGTETVSSLLVPTAAMTLNTNGTYRIVCTREGVEFWSVSSDTANSILLGSLAVPSGNGQPFSSLSVPISMCLRATGTMSTAFAPRITDVTVIRMDFTSYREWGETMAGMGHAYQGLNGGTMGSLALYTNSLAAGAGVALTNTTAAAGSGLGGQFAVQPTLAAGTDGILSSYQVPVGGTAQTPRAFVLTGMRIQGAVTTALTGGPVAYAYSLAYGHTAVSLATAESSIAKAARRIPLGFETYPVTAAAGAIGAGVFVDFSSAPVHVEPGQFIQVVAKNLGTVTSAGVIAILVTPVGYFE